MMGTAFQIGIDPLTFWELTPNELSVLIRAYEQKMQVEHDNQVVMAYLNAYWQRVKKMPSLKEILGKKKVTKQKKTPEEMLEVVKQLNEALGGTVS